MLLSYSQCWGRWELLRIGDAHMSAQMPNAHCTSLWSGVQMMAIVTQEQIIRYHASNFISSSALAAALSSHPTRSISSENIILSSVHKIIQHKQFCSMQGSSRVPYNFGSSALQR